MVVDLKDLNVALFLFRSGVVAAGAVAGDPVEHVDVADGGAAQLCAHPQAGHRPRRREQG